MPNYGAWQPLAFFSRKLNVAESRYSTFDWELLACVSIIRHFRFLVEGRNFFLLSDHKLLRYALHRLSDPWSARQQRHLAYVAEYTSDIRHIAGSENVVANSLNRSPVVVAQPPVVAAVVPTASTGPLRWEQLADTQSTCLQMLALLSSSSLRLQRVAIQTVEVWCDISTGSIGPIIPADLRRAVFDSVHMLIHPGVHALVV